MNNEKRLERDYVYQGRMEIANSGKLNEYSLFEDAFDCARNLLEFTHSNYYLLGDENCYNLSKEVAIQHLVEGNTIIGKIDNQKVIFWMRKCYIVMSKN